VLSWTGKLSFSRVEQLPYIERPSETVK